MKFHLLIMSVGPLCILIQNVEYIYEGETDFRWKSWFSVSSNLSCFNEIMIIDLFLVALLSLVFAFAY